MVLPALVRDWVHSWYCGVSICVALSVACVELHINMSCLAVTAYVPTVVLPALVRDWVHSWYCGVSFCIVLFLCAYLCPVCQCCDLK